jgi:hypothetical protein
MKGSQLILLGILFAVIAGVGTYLYISNHNRQHEAAALALPQSAVFAYQGQKVESAFSAIQKLDWYKNISNNVSITGFAKDFRFFDSVVNSNASLQKSLQKSPLIVSLHVTSAENYQLLFLHQGNNSINEYDIRELVKKNDPDARTIDHTYENYKVYELMSGTKEHLFSYAIIEGIVAISRNTGLVEEAIHAYTSKSKNAMAEKMAENQGEEKVYINYKRLPDFISVYSSPELASAVGSMSTLGSFGSYSWNAHTQGVNLSGNLSTENNKALLWNCLLHQKPGSDGISKFLPAGSVIFMDWHADSFPGYFSRYKEYLTATKQDAAWEHDRQVAEAATSLSVEKSYAPLIGTEWGYAALNLTQDSGDEVMVIKLKDTMQAVKQLEILSGADLNHQDHLAYRGMQISALVADKSFSLLLGTTFSEFKAPFFARIGEYAIFSQTEASVQKCIDAYMNKQSLSTTSNYKSGTKSLAPESNFLLYINPERASAGGENYIRSTYRDKYMANMSAYKTFHSFAFQLVSYGNDFVNNISLGGASGKEGNSELAWSLMLDADLQGSPHIVDDFETGHKAVLVQDKNNTLYLLSPGGGITWKRKLDEPVQGDIYSIDIYKNNTSEYLFATAHKLYLVDKSGKDAGSYPLNLAEATHTGLTVFDLNYDKEYIYMVCCDRGKIYGYHGNGKPLTGWVPMVVDATFPNPVKTFQSTGKNYIYGISAKGTFYLWNEKGSTVIKPVALHTGIKEPVIVSIESKTFNCADTTGNVYTISFDGAVKKKAFPKFRHGPFFGFIAKNDKGKPEYVLSEDKMIAGYKGDSIENWKLLTTDKIEYAPKIIEMGGKKYIGYVSIPSNKVFLFTPDGYSFAGFPRTGNTPFSTGDISGTGDMDLIIGGPGRMLYRYRLSL